MFAWFTIIKYLKSNDFLFLGEQTKGGIDSDSNDTGELEGDMPYNNSTTGNNSGSHRYTKAQARFRYKKGRS